MIDGVDTNGIDTNVDLGWTRDTRGVKPCAKRMSAGWCFEDEGHEGPCVMPHPRDIASTDYGPGRKR